MAIHGWFMVSWFPKVLHYEGNLFWSEDSLSMCKVKIWDTLQPFP